MTPCVAVPARDHHPHLAGRVQLLDQFGEALDVGDLRVAVVADDGVAGAADPLAHVAAHLAETDETELHDQFSDAFLRVR
ncbi:hypothetical protein GCM10017687_45980 [Streptomyces echinatus]